MKNTKDNKKVYGYIYKIINKKNGKIYIGQAVRTIKERFQRHISDAISKRLNTHFARAIRKYGKDSFEIELLSVAYSQKELTSLEQHYIQFYQSIKYGYNETDALEKSGGDTYRYKSQKELKEIRIKISNSKFGAKNPNSTRIKCKNLYTGQELFFDAIIEAQKFFNEPNHIAFSRRCKREIKFLYKGEWLFAYADNAYPTDFTLYKKTHNSTKIKIKKKNSKIWKVFPSYASAERYYNLRPKELSSKAYKKPSAFSYKNLMIVKISKENL